MKEDEANLENYSPKMNVSKWSGINIRLSKNKFNKKRTLVDNTQSNIDYY